MQFKSAYCTKLAEVLREHSYILIKGEKLPVGNSAVLSNFVFYYVPQELDALSEKERATWGDIDSEAPLDLLGVLETVAYKGSTIPSQDLILEKAVGLLAVLEAYTDKSDKHITDAQRPHIKAVLKKFSDIVKEMLDKGIETSEMGRG